MAYRRIYHVAKLLESRAMKPHNSLKNNVSTLKKTAPTTFLNSENTNPAFLTLKNIPGPKPSVPFIGTAWQYFPGGRYNLSNIYEACIDKYVRYGPIVREEFQWHKPVVHLYNPEDFQTVFKYQGKQPLRPISEFVKHYRENRPEKYDTVGLANSLGDEWQCLRRKLGPVLLHLHKTDSMSQPMNTICDDFVNLLRKERDGDTNCIDNIQDLVYRLSLEGIYRLSLETRLGCLNEKLHPDSPAAWMIHSVKLLFEAFQELYYGLPLWKLFPTAAYKKLDKAESIMYDASNNRIQEVIEQLRGAKNSEVKCPMHSQVKDDDVKYGVLQTLINSEDLTDKTIRVTVIDFISGGIFTVTNAFSFLLYHMARNPDVQEKLYKELAEVAPDCNITPDRLKDLKYLKACVKESFRLTPTIPSITRILPESIEASGYHIPAGIPLFCNFTVPCMQADIFPDPDRFYPDRWMRRNYEASFALLPFGFGSRMCVGRRFAEVEMYTALAKIISNFRLVSTGQEVKCKQAFIVVPSHPVSVIFKDRNSC